MARIGNDARRKAAKLIPSLGVSDIERSLGFYKKFFGFKLLDSYELDGRMKWCWLRTRGADLMLQQLTADQQITLNPAIGQCWVLYIQPNDLERYARAASRSWVSRFRHRRDRVRCARVLCVRSGRLRAVGLCSGGCTTMRMMTTTKGSNTAMTMKMKTTMMMTTTMKKKRKRAGVCEC